MQALTTTGNGNALATRATLEDMRERFISFVATTPRTAETYRKGIKRFFDYLNANNITNPTRETVIQYRQHLLDNNYKPATIQGYLSAIKVFFGYLEQEGLYTNITTRVKGVRIDKGHKKDYLSAEDIKKILTHIDTTTLQGKRDYALFALLSTTGLRVIEPSRATIADIGTVGGETVLFIQGKGRTDKSDYIKIAPQVQEALATYLTARGVADATEPLFASQSNRGKNKPLTTRTISGTIKKAMINAGFNSDRLTAHSLRHTTATLALKNGASLVEVQQLLRHTNINTTLIYQHDIERENNHAEAKVANAIFTL